MKHNEKIELLYDRDSSEAYKNLMELEKLSEYDDSLYIYFDTFLKMTESAKYVIRVRGYRLICKLAKWDKSNKFNDIIDELLLKINDEKPTAVRQKLASLKDIIKYKSELNHKIKVFILYLDYSKFKDTMRPLIKRDIDELIVMIDSYKY